MSSPAIAAASGLAAAFVLVVGMAEFFDHFRLVWGIAWYIGSCLILGAACFTAGVIYYLRRVEP